MTVTGEMLYAELAAAARAAGVSIQKFSAPLFSEPNCKLEQLRIAKAPMPPTIARVRALIAGEPLPVTRRGKARYHRDPRAFGLSRIAAEAAGIPPSERSVNETARLVDVSAEKARIEQLRWLTELAHVQRRPGQTVADCVREMRLAVSA